MFPREQIVFMNRLGMCFVSAVLGMLIHILLRLQLVGECELGGLLLQLGELVLVLADLLQVVHGGIVNVSLGSAPLGDDAEPLLGLALLLLLQLLGGLLAEESPQLLLPLGGHESLLLGHG